METTFHPSLTLVPSLANCSLSLCTHSLIESPPITHPNLPFLFLAAQSEVLPLFRFLCLRSFSLWNPNLLVFIFRVFARWVRRGCGFEDRVALTSSRFALGEEEVLCSPCLRCSAAPRPVSVTGCGGLPFQFLFRSWGFPFWCFFITFLMFVLFMSILFVL